jgi:hypothetical protein
VLLHLFAMGYCFNVSALFLEQWLGDRAPPHAVHHDRNNNYDERKETAVKEKIGEEEKGGEKAKAE